MSSPDKQSYDDRLLTRYLLGELPAEEAERLDELSIIDDEFARRLEALENELVDAYVRGENSRADLDRFRSVYMSSAKRREKVEFAEALLALENKTATSPGRQMAGKGFPTGISSWRMFAGARFVQQWGFAGAALAMLLAAAYLLRENSELRKQINGAQAWQAAWDQRERQLQEQLREQRSANAETSRELEQARAAQANLDQLQTVSLLLPPPTRGVSKVASLSLHPGTNFVVLLLALESNDFPAYRVTLKDPAAGRVLWHSGNLDAASLGEQKAVSISFPSSLLKQQNYIVELAGLPTRGAPELIGGYPFRVVLK